MLPVSLTSWLTDFPLGLLQLQDETIVFLIEVNGKSACAFLDGKIVQNTFRKAYSHILLKNIGIKVNQVVVHAAPP
jgi:hypothetical protein